MFLVVHPAPSPARPSGRAPGPYPAGVTETQAEPAATPGASGPDAPTSTARPRPAVGVAVLAVVAFVAVGAALVWRSTSSDPRPAGEAASEPGWALTFSDEFDGEQVDEAKWYVADERRGDEVESPKQSTCLREQNVSVTEGRLVMRTQRADGACAGGQAHSGAGLNTADRFEQAGGRFEVRARWTHPGNYLWGGFWTHGNTGPSWTRENPSEIDVFEYIGKDAEPNLSRFKPAIHYDYTCDGTCGVQNVAHQPYDVTEWHTYAVEWRPTEVADPTTMQIRFSLDDRLITVFDRDGAWRVEPDGRLVQEIEGGWENGAAPFPNPFGLDRPHRLVLSAWVGAPGVDPATVAAGFVPSGGEAALEVDHVRVYAWR